MKKQPLTISEILNSLNNIADKDTEVYFDFGYFSPNKFMSWRGSYDQLSIDYTEEKSIKLKDFIKNCKEIEQGKSFEGYKGGTYSMNGNNIVYVSSYGNASETVICGVEDIGYRVILHTMFDEY